MGFDLWCVYRHTYDSSITYFILVIKWKAIKMTIFNMSAVIINLESLFKCINLHFKGKENIQCWRGRRQNRIKSVYTHVALVTAGRGHTPSFGSFGINRWRISVLVCTVKLPVQVLKHVLVPFPGVHYFLHRNIVRYGQGKHRRLPSYLVSPPQLNSTFKPEALPVGCESIHPP